MKTALLSILFSTIFGALPAFSDAVVCEDRARKIELRMGKTDYAKRQVSATLEDAKNWPTPISFIMPSRSQKWDIGYEHIGVYQGNNGIVLVDVSTEFTKRMAHIVITNVDIDCYDVEIGKRCKTKVEKVPLHCEKL